VEVVQDGVVQNHHAGPVEGCLVDIGVKLIVAQVVKRYRQRGERPEGATQGLGVIGDSASRTRRRCKVVMQVSFSGRIRRYRL
jgi:hypothetical protein